MNPKTLIPILPSPHPARNQRSVKDGSPGERPHRSHLLDPITPACDAIAASEHFGAPPADTRLLLEQLTAIAASVTSGDMNHPESMLVAQATALNVVFSRLTERAMKCNNLELATPLLRLAFRAQAQCSRALQTLTSMRYPAIFARQLNIAHQQVVANASPIPVADLERSRKAAAPAALTSADLPLSPNATPAALTSAGLPLSSNAAPAALISAGLPLCSNPSPENPPSNSFTINQQHPNLVRFPNSNHPGVPKQAASPEPVERAEVSPVPPPPSAALTSAALTSAFPPPASLPERHPFNRPTITHPK